VEGKMFITPSITINDYVVVALSLRFGATELLDFTPKDPRLRCASPLHLAPKALNPELNPEP